MSKSDKTPILIAEDEAMLRLIAVELLQDSGFQVFEAGDGVEALELLKANPQIALLVSDVKMPAWTAMPWSRRDWRSGPTSRC